MDNTISEILLRLKSESLITKAANYNQDIGYLIAKLELAEQNKKTRETNEKELERLKEVDRKTTEFLLSFDAPMWVCRS